MSLRSSIFHADAAGPNLSQENISESRLLQGMSLEEKNWSNLELVLVVAFIDTWQMLVLIQTLSAIRTQTCWHSMWASGSFCAMTSISPWLSQPRADAISAEDAMQDERTRTRGGCFREVAIPYGV